MAPKKSSFIFLRLVVEVHPIEPFLAACPTMRKTCLCWLLSRLSFINHTNVIAYCHVTTIQASTASVANHNNHAIPIHAAINQSQPMLNQRGLHCVIRVGYNASINVNAETVFFRIRGRQGREGFILVAEFFFGGEKFLAENRKISKRLCTTTTTPSASNIEPSLLLNRYNVIAIRNQGSIQH